MAIKPIDLQTNLSQMLEVGRNEHAKSGAVAEQQHILDKEAEENSKTANTKLDESQKGEQTAIRDEDKKQQNKHSREKNEDHEEKSDSHDGTKHLSHDDRMGKHIDVLK